MSTYIAKDFKVGQPRWCPGCGDHAFLASLHKAMAEIGIAPHDNVVISGIGCSSRLPYYMHTYGMQTIHGRAAAVATGCKVANPKLSVWQVSGDGDGLAIGGNHFIHAIRRNVDVNILLLNNRIYGLTKGQYSPTSPRGYVSKTSPFGTVEDPFYPAELCFGARGRFFARCVDTDAPGSVAVLKEAANHKGTSVCEVLQNCVIYNDGTHASVSTKAGRAKNAIYVEHGQPLLFGANKEFGLVQEGFGLKVVTIGENGVTEADILVHDARCEDSTLQLKLALMEGPDFPIALGVIRDVEAPVYDTEVEKQIEEVKQKRSYRNFQELLMTNEIWEVKE
ncbi:MAG: 2-oxoacid:ferredoxin oxidoreductase subunit beta [Phocaeicola sp.]